MSNTAINETYIIEGIGEATEFSACTAVFTNALKSCSGNTTIELGENLIVFNGNTLASIISATTFYGDGSNLTGIGGSSADTFVTGGTYSAGTAVFTNNTGGTFTVTGFYTGSTDVDVYVTGVTFSNNLLTLYRNDGVTFGSTINDFVSLNVNGPISATTFYGDGSNLTGISTQDTVVTGGTYSSGAATFTNNTGGTFSVTGFTYQNIVSVAKDGGDFTSIKDAVDSILDSSETNRYTITVAAGIYEENTIDLTDKPYVSIVGSAIQSVSVRPKTTNQHLFLIGFMNELSFMTFENVGIGYSAIYCDDIGDYAQAHKISFNNCDSNVTILASTQDTIFYGEYLDYNGSFSYGTKIIANNGLLAYANMENYYVYPSGSGVTIGNHIQGSGATLSVFVGDGIGNGISGSTNYQLSDYASLNSISTTADNWDYGIRILNIGGPSRFDIDSYSIVDSSIYDLSVEHPNSFGTFGGGSSTHNKINNLSDNVYWGFLDTNDGEFEITRKMSVTFQDGTHTDLSTLIFESSTMGLMDGGIITHVSGLTFEVSSGYGYLEKTVGTEIYMRIDWPTTQITLSPNNEVYLYFNENEILSSSGTAPDNTNNIILGRVVTDSSSVKFIDSSPYIASHTSNLFSDFNRNALGPIYASGSLVTENITPYHLNISAGDYYYSENNFKPSGGTDVSIIQYHRDGSGGWVTSGTSEVVNGYDDNSGFISPLPLSSFTKHTLYVIGEDINEKYMLVLGQTHYTTLVEAEGADLPTPPNYFDDSVAPIASIFIQQGMSGITEIQDIRPVIGFKAAGISASALHANLLGLSSDDHTQYLLVNGNRPMSGNLSMGGNAVVSATTYNGVTIESHASRHKNGGADEIATATPAPSEIPKADTFGKLDGWISDASTSVKGLARLSQEPATASVPIAVGVNDQRFLNSFTAVTNTTPSLVFSNNSGGTTTISNLRMTSVSATTISATTYVGLPLDVRVTGGTYTSGTATFTNNSGGTFSVSGFSTGFGSNPTLENWFSNSGTAPLNIYFDTLLDSYGVSELTTDGTTWTNNTLNTLSFNVSLSLAWVEDGTYNNVIQSIYIVKNDGISAYDSVTSNLVGLSDVYTSSVSMNMILEPGDSFTCSAIATYNGSNISRNYTQAQLSISSLFVGEQGPQGPVGPSFTGGTVNGATVFTNGLTANTFSATSISATSYNGYTPLPTQAASSTGLVLSFVTDTVYGTLTTPETGTTITITADTTNALLGVTDIIIHSGSTAPTFSSQYKKLSGSGNYTTNVVNYIFCTYITSTEIIYSINQRT